MRRSLALLTIVALGSGAASAADLPGRKGPAPAPAAVSASCLETDGLPTDVFGFTTGSDVADVGAWGATLTGGGTFTSRAARSSNLSGTLQVATGLFRCFEVGPYVAGSFARLKDRTGFRLDTDIYGGGVEFKYKLLGRGVHGLGLTLDADVSTGGVRQKASLAGISLKASYNATNVAARIFMDAQLGANLFGAINLEHVSTYASDLGVNFDASQFNARGSLSYRLASNLYVGAEALYSRSYAGAGYRTFLGDGVFVGPNMLWAINDKWTFNAAYQVQVAGKSRGNPGELNLINYNQHVARVKLGYSF